MRFSKAQLGAAFAFVATMMATNAGATTERTIPQSLMDRYGSEEQSEVIHSYKNPKHNSCKKTGLESFSDRVNSRWKNISQGTLHSRTYNNGRAKFEIDVGRGQGGNVSFNWTLSTRNAPLEGPSQNC